MQQKLGKLVQGDTLDYFFLGKAEYTVCPHFLLKAKNRNYLSNLLS